MPGFQPVDQGDDAPILVLPGRLQSGEAFGGPVFTIGPGAVFDVADPETVGPQDMIKGAQDRAEEAPFGQISRYQSIRGFFCPQIQSDKPSICHYHLAYRSETLV